MNDIRVEGNICAMRNAVPIRFVYCKNEDKPENHKLHLNNYLEVYVYVQGDHQYIVENRLYRLQRGDIILINPREVHKALPLTSCLYERFYLLLDEHCLDGLESNPMPQILSALTQTGNLISPEPEIREQVLRLLYDISKRFQAQPEQSIGALGEVLELLDLCVSRLSQHQPNAKNIASVPELLEKILSYVAENTTTIQSVTQIAHALGMTPQYLSAYFSKQIGTSLKTYIQAKRVALAKDLLDQGMDVTGACFDSGFNDCSYFIKVFKKYTGVTPLQYQKKLR